MMEDTWEIVELKKEEVIDSAMCNYAFCGIHCNGGVNS